MDQNIIKKPNGGFEITIKAAVFSFPESRNIGGVLGGIVVFALNYLKFILKSIYSISGFLCLIDNLLHHIHIAILLCPLPTALCSRDFLCLQKLFSKNIRFSLAVLGSALLRVYERGNSTRFRGCENWQKEIPLQIG